MTNEELMQLMTEMGLHEGGIENWIPDNAWLLVANRAIEIEREACANICFDAVNILNLPSQPEFDGDVRHIEKRLAENIGKAIRARGNT